MGFAAIIVVLATSFLSGCGSRFGPGFSAEDPAYFGAVPHLVDTESETAIVWTYGTLGFFYQPRYQVKNGALYCSLQATSSSGRLAGRKAKLPIEGSAAVEALRQGGAYWWSRDEPPLKLAVIR